MSFKRLIKFEKYKTNFFFNSQYVFLNKNFIEIL